MKGLKELIAKKLKSGSVLDEGMKSSKMSVLDELENLADEGIADSMKKVTVAAPDSESLEAGLEMAQDSVGEFDEMADDMVEESIEEGDMVESEDLEDDLEDMDIEELEELLASIKAKKMGAVDPEMEE